ncbi:unnamed protein product [Amoebophrya sp. A25]|nr:unnamed protein product [Amoebophrya sp. A25]|eukprot:GSA25T00009890001.1
MAAPASTAMGAALNGSGSASMPLLGAAGGDLGRRPDYTVVGALASPGLIAFYTLTAALVLLTILFRYCFAGARFASCVALFEDESGVCSESNKERHQVQIGYRRHALGEILYYSWVSFAVGLQAVLGVLCFGILADDRNKYLWVANSTFDLKFCTKELLIVGNGKTGSIKTEDGTLRVVPPWCNVQNGATTPAFEFRNYASIFLVFFLAFLAAIFVLLHPRLRFRQWFFLPCDLRKCQFVVLEEWKRKQEVGAGTSTSSNNEVNKVPLLAETSSVNGNTSRGEQETSAVVELNTDEKISDRDRVFAERNCFDMYFHDWRSVQTVAVESSQSRRSTKVSMKHDDDLSPDDYLSAFEQRLNFRHTTTPEKNEPTGSCSSEGGEMKYIWFRCIMYFYCEERNLFVVPQTEILDGKMTTAAVRQIYSGPFLRESMEEFRHQQLSTAILDQQEDEKGNSLCATKSHQRTRIPPLKPNTRELSQWKYKIYGENIIAVEAPNYFKFLSQEFLDFATLFQFHCLWGGSIFTNWMLSIVSGVMCIIFGCVNAYNTWKNQLEIQALASKTATRDVRVFRFLGEDVDRVPGPGTRCAKGYSDKSGVSAQDVHEEENSSIVRHLGINLSSSSGLDHRSFGAKRVSKRRSTAAKHGVRPSPSRYFESELVHVSKLVPGDLIEIHNSGTVPCDCVVLDGSVVVNESNLTGEAMPVQKFALDDGDDILCRKRHGKKNILSSGTTVMESRRKVQTRTSAVSFSHCFPSKNNRASLVNGAQQAEAQEHLHDEQWRNNYLSSPDTDASPPRMSLERTRSQHHEEGAVAIVLATGAQTSKGDMIRNILYAPPISFELYDKQAVGVCINACIAAVIMCVSVFSQAEWRALLIGGFFEAVTTVSRLVSPLVLVGFKIAQGYSAKRMKAGQYEIQSLAYNRIPMAGKLEVQCFDKTGTLTEETLDLVGLEAVDRLDRLLQRDSIQAEMDAVGSLSFELIEEQDDTGRSLVNDGHQSQNKATRRGPSGTAAAGDDFRIINLKSASCSEMELHVPEVTLGPLRHCKDGAPEVGRDFSLADLAAATCHTVTRLENGELAGNKVECELVNFYQHLERFEPDEALIGPVKATADKMVDDVHDMEIQYQLEHRTKSDNVPIARTIRQFEFDQKIQLQSVIVDSLLGAETTRFLFTKGSPAKVAKRCRPESLPTDFYERTQEISRNGCYLLALACRTLPIGTSQNSTPRRGTSGTTEDACPRTPLGTRAEDVVGGSEAGTRKSSKANHDLWEQEENERVRSVSGDLRGSDGVCGRTTKREELEKDLTFLGLLYFRNELKPCTTSAIEELREGGVLNVMVTGDNLWNGLHIAKKCGILHRQDSSCRPVFLVDVEEDVKVCADICADDAASPARTADATSSEQDQTPTTINLDDAQNVAAGRGNGDMQINARPVQKNTSKRVVFTREPVNSAQRNTGSSQKDSSSANTNDEVLEQEQMQWRYTSLAALDADLEELSKSISADNDRSKAALFGITQQAFTYLADNDPETLSAIFPHIRVFGGMSPSGKVEVVDRWAAAGKVVGMCGDGGNDSGALKRAHVGIALVSKTSTSSEVSIVSSFSSSGSHPCTESQDLLHPNITGKGREDETTPLVASCEEDILDEVRSESSDGQHPPVSVHAVVQLLKEGRCALENSVACYKFFVYYGFLSASSKFLMQSRAAYYSEMIFLFQDAFLVVLITYILASGRPHAVLADFTPSANLLGLQVTAGWLLPVGVQIAALSSAYAYMEAQAWYEYADPLVTEIDVAAWWEKPGATASVVTGWWSVASALVGAVLFSYGGKQRRSSLRNRVLIGSLLILLPLWIAILFTTNNTLNCLFRLNCTNENSWNTTLQPFTFFLNSRELKNGAVWMQEYRPTTASSRPTSNSNSTATSRDPATRTSATTVSEIALLLKTGELEDNAAPFQNDAAMATTGLGCIATRDYLRQKFPQSKVNLKLTDNQCVVEIKQFVSAIASAAQVEAECHRRCAATWKFDANKKDMQRRRASPPASSASGGALAPAGTTTGEEESNGGNNPTNNPFSQDTQNIERLFCWWAAVSLERNPQTQKIDSATCYVLPRLDARGARAIGPDFSQYVSHLRHRFRLSAAYMGTGQQGTERVDTGEPGSAAASTFLASSGRTGGNFRTRAGRENVSAIAEKPFTSVAFRTGGRAVDASVPSGFEQINIAALHFRNAHNVLAWHPQTQQREDQYRQPSEKTRTLSYAAVLVALVAAAFFINSFLVVVLVKGPFATWLYRKWYRKK